VLYSIGQDAFPDNKGHVIDLFEHGDTVMVLQTDFSAHALTTSTLVDKQQRHMETESVFACVLVNRSAGGRLTHFTAYFHRAELLGQLGLTSAAT